MTEAPMPGAEPMEDLLAALQARGAAQYDPVGWHYMQTLAQRSRASPGSAQLLLQGKLRQALVNFQARMQTQMQTRMQEAALTNASTAPSATPSPLATLLRDMAQDSPNTPTGKPANWRTESPHIQQFRQQLGKIRVHKQVSQAIAQAPQNAGPINSHMLVLRSLGLMRDISPDYLNRFMGYIDTLLCLDQAGQGKSAPKKTASSKAEK